MSVYKKLLNIQSKLKAPKNQYNSFGKYSYRSCEDILEGLKPLLKESNATLIIDDEIVNVGDRFYIKATAKLIDIESGEHISTSAYAREDEVKKGMDKAQVTGSASSYARKYALNGLFAIDDTKDSDATNKHESDTRGQADTKTVNNTISNAQAKRMFAIAGNQEIVKDVLQTFGYKSSTDVRKADYNKICDVIAKSARAKNTNPNCDDCGKGLSSAEVDWCTSNNFDGLYCRDCQPKHKKMAK